MPNELWYSKRHTGGRRRARPRPCGGVRRKGAGRVPFPPADVPGAAFLGVCRVPCWAGGTPAAEESARRGMHSRVRFKRWGAAVR